MSLDVINLASKVSSEESSGFWFGGSSSMASSQDIRCARVTRLETSMYGWRVWVVCEVGKLGRVLCVGEGGKGG